MIRIKNIRFNMESLYLMMFGAYSFIQIINASLYSINTIANVVMLAVSAIMAALFILRESFNVKHLIVSLLLVATFTFTTFTTGRKNLFLYCFIILCAESVDFKKIVKVSVAATFSAVAVVILSSYAGILRDYTYNHSGSIAHSLGFTYYSAYPYIIFFNMIGYMYVRKKKLTWAEIIFFWLLNSYIYKVSTLRLSYYLALFVIGLYIVLIKFDFGNINSRLFRYISLIAYPFTFIFTIVCALKYNPESAIWVKLNEALSSRISLSHTAFARYNVTLFGQHIENNNMVNQRIVYMNYFYIDSGFVYAILGYGLVFTVLVLIMYSLLFNHVCRKNDKMLFIWLFVLMIFTIINNVWINITYNPILLLFIKAFKETFIKSSIINTEWITGRLQNAYGKSRHKKIIF